MLGGFRNFNQYGVGNEQSFDIERLQRQQQQQQQQQGGDALTPPTPTPPQPTQPQGPNPGPIPFGGMPQAVTFPGSYGNQNGLLAEQLAAGFGGNVPEMTAGFDARFAPQTAHYIQRPDQLQGLLQSLGIESGQPYGADASGASSQTSGDDDDEWLIRPNRFGEGGVRR